MQEWSQKFYGEPRAKGSVAAYAHKLPTGKWRGVVTHSKQSKEWEAQIREQIKFEGEPLDGPLHVILTFWLTRPKTVARDFPSVVPDIDKLTRAVLDALKGVIVDDSRVVQLSAVKYYADGVEPGVRVTIKRL